MRALIEVWDLPRACVSSRGPGWAPPPLGSPQPPSPSAQSLQFNSLQIKMAFVPWKINICMGEKTQRKEGNIAMENILKININPE